MPSGDHVGVAPGAALTPVACWVRARDSPPSAGSSEICPSRRNSSVLPSGDQRATGMSPPSVNVSCAGAPPATSWRQRWQTRRPAFQSAAAESKRPCVRQARAAGPMTRGSSARSTSVSGRRFCAASRRRRRRSRPGTPRAPCAATGGASLMRCGASCEILDRNQGAVRHERLSPHGGFRADAASSLVARGARGRVPGGGRGRFRRPATSASAPAKRCPPSTCTIGRSARRDETRPASCANAVLILHGTGGTGAGFLSQTFGGELFGPGQLLDATRYFIILPDGIGHGKSSKPSDGLRARFPKYTYDDMVRAAARDARRWAEGEPPAPRARHVDGRDALLGLGRDVSGLCRRPRCRWRARRRQIAGRNRVDAQDDHRQHHAGSRRGRTATTASSRARAWSARSTC